MERSQAIRSLGEPTPRQIAKRKGASPMRLPVFGFLGLIGLGTLLLSLPIAHVGYLSMIDALFTATSAASVTGLSVVDTGTHFTLFGQIVLILLMQFGGLGIMTFSTSLLLITGAKAGFAQQSVILSSFTQADGKYNPGNILKEVVKFTVVIETIGALLFFSQAEHLEMGQRILFAVFHSVSAFCNAGFSTQADSFASYQTNGVINLTLIGLISAGGIGFVTLSEMLTLHKRKTTLRRMSLHSRLNLSTYAILLILGAGIILFMEWSNSLEHLTWYHKLLAALFQSSTSRTAGFNTLPIGIFTSQTLFFVLILMFIGGSSGSCAGGIKTNTSAVLAVLGFNRFWGRERSQIMNRTIPDDTIEKATRLFVLAITLVTAATLVLLVTESGRFTAQQSHEMFLPLFFEAVSAFATCGLSMGVTAEFSDLGRLVLIGLMFIGRLGPLVIITAVSKPTEERPWFAEEQIMIG